METMRSFLSVLVASMVVAVVACGGSPSPAQEPTASPPPPAASAESGSTMKITESMGAMPREPAVGTSPPPPTAADVAAWWPAAPKADTKHEATASAGAPAASAHADQVVAGIRARFRSCYQKALDVDPAVSGGPPTFAITHVNGAITKVDVLCPAVPKPFEQCLREVIMRSDLSPPGSGRQIMGAPCPDTPKK